MIRALTLVALVLAACSPEPTPAAIRPAVAAAVAPAGPALYRMEGGMAVRVENGVRVAIAPGWVELRFSPFPFRRKTDLDVTVLTASGAAADVTVSYDMVDMPHGVETERAKASGAGHYLAELPLAMEGTWKITVSVVVEGVTSTIVMLIYDVQV